VHEKLFESYFTCPPQDLMNGSETSKFYQLAQRILFIVENANPERENIANRNAVALFLYFDCPEFDKTMLNFEQLIKTPFRKHFKQMRYQTLFKNLQNSNFAGGNEAWFDYMKKRYFSD